MSERERRRKEGGGREGRKEGGRGGRGREGREGEMKEGLTHLAIYMYMYLVKFNTIQ